MADYLSKLPTELLIEIGNYLTFNRLLILGTVCKIFNTLVYQTVWNHTFESNNYDKLNFILDRYQIKNLKITVPFLYIEPVYIFKIKKLKYLDSLTLLNLDWDDIKLDMDLRKLKLIDCPSSEPIFDYFSRIEEINLSYSKIIDSDLTKFNPKTLRKINLEGCKSITDLGMQYLTLIQIANFDRTTISDKGLSYLTNLTKLSVNYCKNITDSGIKILYQLRKLRARGTKIMGEFIPYLTNLISFDISETNIAYENAIKLTQCQKLVLDKCYGIDNSTIKLWTNLQSIQFNQLHYIESCTIGTLTNLTYLNSSHIPMQDSDLVKLTNLRQLILSPQTYNLSINTIRALTKLRSLEITWYDVKSDIISELTNLQFLTIHFQERISDNITMLTNLDTLKIYNFHIQHYSRYRRDYLQCLNNHLQYLNDHGVRINRK